MGIFLCEEAKVEDLENAIISNYEGENIALLGCGSGLEKFAGLVSRFVNIDLNPTLLGLKHRAFVVFYKKDLNIERVYSVPCIYVFESLLDFVTCEINFTSEVKFIIDIKAVIKNIYTEMDSLFSYVTSFISCAENLLYNAVIFGEDSAENAQLLLNTIKEFLLSVNDEKVSAVNIYLLVNACKKFVKIKNKMLEKTNGNLALNCAKNYEKLLGETFSFLAVYLQNIFANINNKFFELNSFYVDIPSGLTLKNFITKKYSFNINLFKDFLTVCDMKNIEKLLILNRQKLKDINNCVLGVSSLAVKSYNKKICDLASRVNDLDFTRLKCSILKGIDDCEKCMPKIIKSLGYFDDLV